MLYIIRFLIGWCVLILILCIYVMLALIFWELDDERSWRDAIVAICGKKIYNCMWLKSINTEYSYDN